MQNKEIRVTKQGVVMSQFPMNFEVSTEATSGISKKWTGRGANTENITIAIPPEFHGPGHAFTPEDLYALSVLSCVIASYKVLCEKHEVTFEKLDGKASVTMDRNPAFNGIALTDLTITLDIKNSSNKEKARELLDTAIKHCPVANSIKTGKTYHINIS